MRYDRFLIGLALTAACPAFAQDAALTAKERAVQAATARPATWAARAQEFRKWLANATDDQGKPLSAAARKGHISDQVHTLDKELARAASIAPAATAQAILGDKCLAKWLGVDCQVPLSGTLRDADGTRILWQLQSGASEEDGLGMGAMLWDASGTGEPRLIGWTFEGVYMEAPRYNPELQLLWVSGRMMGTGDGNADILYQRRDGKWIEIELESWRADLEKRLPKGLGAWKGVDYDLTSLSAATELWKDSDANCCATGGRATMDFEIEGSSLKLKTISAQIGGPDTAWKEY
ncbi:hypothetical protein [Sphingomonas soli]|uniref:hypothetical protein n=1 Tax=Sphingomonas soli TaxID=266127 RepID=UPI000832FB52|nr:hypothetical protein [Sphingomonas soli]